MISCQGPVVLPPSGGKVTGSAAAFSVPGLVSIASGSAHASGEVTAPTWTTVVNASVEALDIFDGMITADRICAKITTVHPAVGYTPSVSFVATQFTNLRVAGNEVTPNLNLGMLAHQPANDQPYISDPKFLNKARAECAAITDVSGASDRLKQLFAWNPSKIKSTARVDCSLVAGVSGFTSGQAFGHVLIVPNFGNVYLGELGVSNHIEVTMLRVELTQRGKTELRVVNCDSQGHTMP